MSATTMTTTVMAATTMVLYETMPPKPAPQNSADRPSFPESTLIPILDTKLRMSSDNTIDDDAVKAEGGVGLADPAIRFVLRREEEGVVIVEAAEKSGGG